MIIQNTKIQTRPPLVENAYYNSNIYNKNMLKWMAAREYCKQYGWKFKIWTEREII